jgi:hypothetical protein
MRVPDMILASAVFLCVKDARNRASCWDRVLHIDQVGNS